MKCVIKECSSEANLPGYACGPNHGYRWKMIKEAIKEGLRQYSTFSGRYQLTDEEIEYYKQFMK